MLRFRSPIISSYASILILLSACGGDETEKCTLVERLVACDIASEDAFKACNGSSSRPTPQDRAVGECSQKCSDKASCSDFSAALCVGSNASVGEEPKSESFSLRACWDDCLATFAPFTCDDDVKYTELEKCDGFERCDDGADERGCPTFACKSGETVSAQKKCDGSDDCDDSSDESGCPTFRCEDGTTILTVDKCDGFEDCEDASDEVGCKKRDFELMCPNGPDGAPRPGGIIRFD